MKEKKSWEKKLEKYINSDKHNFDCASYSEGQKCCLEKRWIKNFISNLLSSSKQEAIKEVAEKIKREEKKLDGKETIL